MCRDRDHRDSNVLFLRRFKVFAAQKSATVPSLLRYRRWSLRQSNLPPQLQGGPRNGSGAGWLAPGLSLMASTLHLGVDWKAFSSERRFPMSAQIIQLSDHRK